MEYEGTMLDYTRRAKITKLAGGVFTLKRLNMPENQSYTFYAASDGLVRIKSDYRAWELVAPDAAFVFRAFSTVGELLTGLAAYLRDHPVFAWEEFCEDLQNSETRALVNAAIGSGSVTIAGNSGTYPGSAAVLPKPETFADVADWLVTLCGAAFLAAPISEITQCSDEGRIFRFEVRGAQSTAFQLDLPALATSWDEASPVYSATDPDEVISANPAVAYNSDYDIFYDSLSAALSEAESGEHIYLLRDLILSEDTEVPAGVKLVIPSVGDWGDSLPYGANTHSRCHGGAPYVTLTLAANLTVRGTLIVCGKQQAWYTETGLRSGNYGAVEIQSGKYLIIRGSCYARGLICGGGQMLVTNGANLLPLMAVHDWRGGTAMQAAYNAGVWPFNLWGFEGFTCETTVYAGAFVKASFFIYSDAIGSQRKDFEVIGADGLIRLLSGNAVFSYEAPAHTIRIDGTAEFEEMSQTFTYALYSMNLTTKGKAFPFSYFVKLAVNGTLTLDRQPIKLLPGSGCAVRGLLRITTLGEAYVYDADSYSAQFYHHYQYEDFVPPVDAAIMEVDGGTVELQSAPAGSAAVSMVQTSTSSTSATTYYSWTLGSNSTTVQGNRTSSSKSGFSQTLTLTAAEDGVVSFSFTCPNYATLTIDGETKTGLGTFSKKMFLGDSITVKVKFLSDSGSSRTVKLTNIVQNTGGAGMLASSDSSLANIPHTGSFARSVLVGEYANNSEKVNVTFYAE